MTGPEGECAFIMLVASPTFKTLWRNPQRNKYYCSYNQRNLYFCIFICRKSQSSFIEIKLVKPLLARPLIKDLSPDQTFALNCLENAI